jgi:ABC-type Zn uptake system ZnuABC Zn-binding protein ZnuA
LPDAKEHLEEVRRRPAGQGLPRRSLGCRSLGRSARCVAAAVAFTLAAAHAGLAQERLRVVATTTDLKSLTEAVGGDRVEVTSLVPPSVDAEDYQPKPHDVVRLKDAQFVVRVGLDYDLWFDRLLTRANVRGIRRGEPGYLDASAAVAILDIRGTSVGPTDGHAHGSGNPHYWLDPKNAEIVTGNILEGLVRIDPANASSYEANRIAFLKRLETRLGDWTAALAPLQSHPMIAYHNNWAYFARRFRLNFIGFIEPRPGVPASPAHLAGLLRIMQDQAVRTIVRATHDPAKDAAFLAGKTGARVVVLAGSVGPPPSDYVSLFEGNVAALVAAQEKR